MAICKTPTWEEYKNPNTLGYIIYLIKNAPQYDYLVLRIIDELSTNEYDDEEEHQGDNNEDG